MIMRLKRHIIENGRKASPRGIPFLDRVIEVEDNENQKHQPQNEQNPQRRHYREDCETVRCSIEQCTVLQLGRAETDLHDRQNNCDVDNDSQDPGKILFHKACIRMIAI